MGNSIIEWSDIFKIAASSSALTSLASWGLNHVFVLRSSLKRDARYLAQRLAVILERFALDCSECISDNDLNRSSDGHAGRRRLSLPELGTFPTDADWKALDLDLVERVMSLPNKLVAAERMISFWWEVGDEDDMQNATDHKAGSCGLESWLAAVALRQRYKIPPSDLVRVSWDFVALLQQKSELDDAQRLKNNETSSSKRK